MRAALRSASFSRVTHAVSSAHGRAVTHTHDRLDDCVGAVDCDRDREARSSDRAACAERRTRRPLEVTRAPGSHLLLEYLVSPMSRGISGADKNSFRLRSRRTLRSRGERA